MSLLTSFSEKPVERDDGSGYCVTRERGGKAALPLALFVHGTMMVSHRLLHGRRPCVSRVHRNNNNTTVSGEKGRQVERERERQTQARTHSPRE